MATPQPAPQPKSRPRPYRRFLTSALHQRFVHASGLGLIVCWNTAFWLAEKDSYFWSWFPIGWTGFRAILLFGSCLAVFILRVASLQMGRRATTSPFESFRRSIFNITTVHIVFWYLFSAWWFSEVYIWFSSKSDKLGWIVRGDLSTPDRLNERPLYLRSVFLMLAAGQSAVHLQNDYSSLYLPISLPSKTPTADSRTHKFLPISARMQKTLPEIVQRCVITSAGFALLGPFIYALFLRQTFWSWHVSFAKLIYNLPRSDAMPSGYPPSRPSFMLRSFAVSLLLTLTWETTSFFFTTFLSQEPLKKEQPLSAGSKDPNGTLITGLRAKRDVVKTFAFWELVIISQKHAERRRSIFADIERDGGPAWSQMLNASLDVVQSVVLRIEAATTRETKPVEQAQDMDEMEIDSLPRIAPPIQTKPIYADSPPPRTRTEEIESYLDRGAQRIGQSRRPFQPSMPEVKGLLKYMGPAGSPLEDASWRSLTQYLWSHIRNSTVGRFFKTTFERRVNAVVIGSPQANAAVIVDAVEATTRMLVASLSEDIYGKVIGGVSGTVRTFTNTILAIETFVHEVDEEAVEDSNIEEVEAVFAKLKAGLAELLSAFQLYLTDNGLSAVEHRQAQNASRPGRLLHERAEWKRVNDQAREKPPQAQRLQNGGVKGNARSKGNGIEHQGTQRPNGRTGEQKPGNGDRNGGGRGSQKRLEPQDPVRKKLFPELMPQDTVRREMEMVR